MTERPRSIVRFEIVYFIIIALGLAAVATSWNEMMANVQVQATVARLGMGLVLGPIALGVVIQLLLWYFIARRGSVVAKWIFVVLTGGGLTWSLYTIATRGSANAATGVIDVAAIVLQIFAIILLFRPDTPPWFGEDVAQA